MIQLKKDIVVIIYQRNVNCVCCNNLEGNPTIKYEYGEFYSSYEELKKWSDNILNKYKLDGYQYDTVKFSLVEDRKI